VDGEESRWRTERRKTRACKSRRVTISPRLPVDGKEVVHPKRETENKKMDGHQDGRA
jgi:hypothetical protein